MLALSALDDQGHGYGLVIDHATKGIGIHVR